jgi:monoterpene epsilon-lactone hydrolase
MSWQNHVLTAILRATFLRHAASMSSIDVAAMRQRTSKRVWSPRVPRPWRLRVETTAGATEGEWIELATDQTTNKTANRANRGADSNNGNHVRTILYLHGGGYYFCSPSTHRSITFTLASFANARTFVPKYRLAPEYPFPAALDDAVAAYCRLLADGVPASSIVIAGDSAGGGLAMATLIALRDSKIALPAGAMVFSPWTDLAATGPSLTTNDGRDAMFPGRMIKLAASLYLAETPATHPLASPLYADLGGLPPLLIQVSDSEVLLDDSVRLAERARAAGVRVQLEVWPGLPHAWHIFWPFLPESKSAIAAAAAFARSLTHPDQPGDQLSNRLGERLGERSGERSDKAGAMDS